MDERHATAAQECPVPAPRIVAMGPALAPADVADRLDAVAYTFSAGHGEVAVVDGFGARVAVERGHLELHDGLAEHRRVRRFAKIDAPRRLVVGIGTEGMVTFDALRWCTRTAVPVAILGADGAALAAGPPGRNDARLLRAQALALYGPAGIEITQYLITTKLRGQARVLAARLGEHDAASTLMELLEAIDGAGSIEEIRQLEAVGANVYWAAWERVAEVVFARKDVPRVPEHWCRFNGRRSPVNPGSPRSATDCLGATLNYSYRLAEIEATLALRRMGLSESLGVLHADMSGRPSFSCDVMEAVRSLVDEHALDLVKGPLRKRTFVEDARGVVRCMAPLTHQLAQAMPAYAHALGPVVEHVAGLLASSSPYDVKVPTVLSGAKHKAAARRRVEAESETVARVPASRGPKPGRIAPRGRPRRKPMAELPLPAVVCQGCGSALPVEPDRARSRRGWCDRCLPERRDEIEKPMQAASLAHAAAFAEAAGTRPSHTPEASAARKARNRQQALAQRAWDRKAPQGADETWYREVIAPQLATVTLPAIAKATGVSTSAASKWRAGRAVPHPRHWSALAELAGVALDVDISPTDAEPTVDYETGEQIPPLA